MYCLYFSPYFKKSIKNREIKNKNPPLWFDINVTEKGFLIFNILVFFLTRTSLLLIIHCTFALKEKMQMSYNK